MELFWFIYVCHTCGGGRLYAQKVWLFSYLESLHLEPLSKATGLPLHAKIGTKDSEALLHELKTEAHGQHLLIAWRHGDMPALLTAFGASPEKLLPNGNWPDDVFDWVVVLTMDPDGHLSSSRLIREQLKMTALVP